MIRLPITRSSGCRLFSKLRLTSSGSRRTVGLRSGVRRFVFGDDRGAAMVEFALVVSLVFLPMVFGIIEFGRFIWTKTMITAAAREGVRYAIVHGTQSPSVADSAAVADYVIGRTKLSGIVVHPSWADSKDPGDTAIVTVTYTYTPVVPIMSSKNLSSTSRQIISF